MSKVLLVDDSALVRKQIMAMLASEGAEVLEAENGLEGIKRLRENDGEIKLVFSDINMPVMDGIAMITKYSELIESGDLKPTTIIVLSTEDDTKLIAKAREQGAKGWVVKPVQEEHIKQIYRSLV